MKKHLIVAAALVAAGCGHIRQNVEPVRKLDDRQICVVREPSAREGFLNAYEKALQSKGFTVVVVEETFVPKSCTLVSSYRARWGYGMYAPTMTYADLRVIKDGVLAGRATYDATSRNTIDKIINPEDKIIELVNRLFPYR